MQSNNQSEDQEFAEEYQYFRADVKSVIISNVLILVLLVGAHFLNEKIGFVDRLLKIF